MFFGLRNFFLGFFKMPTPPVEQALPHDVPGPQDLEDSVGRGGGMIFLGRRGGGLRQGRGQVLLSYLVLSRLKRR